MSSVFKMILACTEKKSGGKKKPAYRWFSRN
jgi:hypothetical protein